MQSWTHTTTVAIIWHHFAPQTKYITSHIIAENGKKLLFLVWGAKLFRILASLWSLITLSRCRNIKYVIVACAQLWFSSIFVKVPGTEAFVDLTRESPGEAEVERSK